MDWDQLHAGSVESVSVKHHFSVPVGDTAQRNETSGYAEGTVRYNTDLGTMEFFNGNEWRQFTYNQIFKMGINSWSWSIWWRIIQIHPQYKMLFNSINIQHLGMHKILVITNWNYSARHNTRGEGASSGLFAGGFVMSMDQITIDINNVIRRKCNRFW